MEEQLVALQNIVQQLAQNFQALQQNIQVQGIGAQQIPPPAVDDGVGQAAVAPAVVGVGAGDPGQVAADGAAVANQGVLEVQPNNPNVVIVDTERDAKFLKQLTGSITFTKLVHQKTETFVRFSEELKNWFRGAGISAAKQERLLNDGVNIKLSTILDAQVQLIIGKQSDEIIRDHLREALSPEECATGLGDWRNLFKLFGQNKISQFVQLASTGLNILNQKGEKPFDREYQHFVRTVNRAEKLISDFDVDARQKICAAVFASSYPQIASNLNIQLSLAEKQSASVFLESLMQAALNATKRKRVNADDADDESSDGEQHQKKRIAVEHYCTHCGKANHSAEECHSKDKPEIQLAKKLHVLQKECSNGRIPLAKVQEALGISHAPYKLKSRDEVQPNNS